MVRAQLARTGAHAAHPAYVARRPDPAPRGEPAPSSSHRFDLTAIPATPGLAIGAADAPAEREADSAAERVMRGEPVRIAAGAPPGIERKCAACADEEEEEEPRLMRASGRAFDPLGGSPAPPVVEEVLARPGRPLDPSVRREIEPLFARSFGEVRVHDDGLADRSARAINALAYTVGNHIAFARDGYAPDEADGRRLLVHELAHVAQQSGAVQPATLRRYPYRTNWMNLERRHLVDSVSHSYWLALTNERYTFIEQSHRMAANDEERDAVLAALWASNPPATVSRPIELMVAVQRPPASPGGTAPPPLLYRFRFSPPTPPSGKPGLAAEFVREGGGRMPAATAVPPDFRSHSVWEAELERLRSPTRPAADRLGNVTFPAGLPFDERHAIAYAVANYFDTGGARNTEIDAIVPVGAGTRTLLVTLRFGANNDVAIQPIGEAGTGAGQVDTNRMDVTRVSGFPGTAAADATLRAWWRTRYRGGGALTTPAPAAPASAGPAAGAPSAPSAAANASLIAEMNRLMSAGSTTPRWFQANYGMAILDAGAAVRRLRRVHRVPAVLLTDLRDPVSADLVSLELALQTLPNAELRLLRGVRVGRKAASMESVGGVWQAGGGYSALALSQRTGRRNDRTILIFDSFRTADASRFTGSTAGGALAISTMNIIHELGHEVAYQGGVEAAFAAWLSANPQSPPTEYSARNTSELFAEFFALFHSDPHFLCGSAPLMYAWFAELARTGRAPRPRATLTPPTTCPP